MKHRKEITLAMYKYMLQNLVNNLVVKYIIRIFVSNKTIKYEI